MNEVRDSYRAVASNRQTETHAFHYFFVFVVNIVIIGNRLNAYDREINLGPRTLPLVMFFFPGNSLSHNLSLATALSHVI